MRTHELKVLPEFFEALLDGSKPFEIRRDDRSFMVGDELVLKEWDPTPWNSNWMSNPRGYTTRELRRTITYKFPGGRMGIPEGVCVLGLSRPSPGKRDKDE